jgi:NhaP-type Na+/H+ or K+/H+ antiporter
MGNHLPSPQSGDAGDDRGTSPVREDVQPATGAYRSLNAEKSRHCAAIGLHMTTTNNILLGLGLVIVLALGCELIATRTRLPAIVLLLPAGFIAGAVTNDVRPAFLFGNTFQPIVSLGVGLILFEAGLRLRFDELQGGSRRVVLRLIPIGVLLTVLGVTLGAKLIFGLGWGSSLMLGAILVVSGPTVVLPLLEFVRPTDRVRSILKWEGVLIDPIGALLGVLVFTALKAHAAGGGAFKPGEMAVSIVTGLVVGAIAAGVLWLLLGSLQRSVPKQSIAAALLTVIAAVVAADLIRDDSGFVAATAMGVFLANQRRLDVSRVLEFQGTVVQLLIGVLFVLISASVTPSSVGPLVAGGLGLVALMIFVIRPLAVALGTRGSALGRPERMFMGWLAPRGIVAAATASSFGPALAKAGVSGANKILPVAFMAIFGTVAIYGLTVAPVARRLGVAGTAAIVVLVVGGHNWARSIAGALKAAGVGVRLWTGQAGEQSAARAAGIDAGNARLGVERAAREAELEEVTDALLLTGSDNFNALAAYELRQELGHDHVFRLARESELLDLEPGYAEGRELFEPQLTFSELTRRFDAGAGVTQAGANGRSETNGTPSERSTLLFVVSSTGQLQVATTRSAPSPSDGDTTIWLTAGKAGGRQARPLPGE